MSKHLSVLIALAVILIASKAIAIEGAAEAPRADAARDGSSIEAVNAVIPAEYNLATPIRLTVPEDLAIPRNIDERMALDAASERPIIDQHEAQAAVHVGQGAERTTSASEKTPGQGRTLTALDRNVGVNWAEALQERSAKPENGFTAADGPVTASRQAPLAKPSASEQAPSRASIPEVSRFSTGGAALGGFMTTVAAAATFLYSLAAGNPAAFLLGGMFSVFGMVFVLGAGAGNKIESVRQGAYLALGAIMGLGGMLAASWSALSGNTGTAALSFIVSVIPAVGAMALGGIPDRDLSRIMKTLGGRMRSLGSALKAFGRTLAGQVLKYAAIGAAGLGAMMFFMEMLTSFHNSDAAGVVLAGPVIGALFGAIYAVVARFVPDLRAVEGLASDLKSLGIPVQTAIHRGRVRVTVLSNAQDFERAVSYVQSQRGWRFGTGRGTISVDQSGEFAAPSDRLAASVAPGIRFASIPARRTARTGAGVTIARENSRWLADHSKLIIAACIAASLTFASAVAASLMLLAN